MGLYERIRDLAKLKGYSVNRLEQELGFARSSISKFNKNKPSVDKLRKISDFLDTTMENLMGTESAENDQQGSDSLYTAAQLYSGSSSAARLFESEEMINKYCHIANIQQHITPHMFRHSFATLLLEENVDIRYIQTMLGHSSIHVTEIYTHVTMSKQKDILNSKHPRKNMNIANTL